MNSSEKPAAVDFCASDAPACDAGTLDVDSREYAVAFTGHRTYDGEADAALRATVVELFARGFRAFLCGMAVGFDMAAAEAVLAYRGKCPGLQLVCVVPFEGQQQRFSHTDRECYTRILAAADRTVILAPAYRPDCYAVRNNYLTDHAAVLVAWYDGSPGGTAYTVRRALRRGLDVRNLCPSALVATRSDQRLF